MCLLKMWEGCGKFSRIQFSLVFQSIRIHLLPVLDVSLNVFVQLCASLDVKTSAHLNRLLPKRTYLTMAGKVADMTSEVVLSESEKTYILHSVEANFRCDGRKRNEVRPVVLETGVVSHASGSAHLRLANTDILVGVKAELEAPLPGALNQGRLEFFVDCSGVSLLFSSLTASSSSKRHSCI